MLQPRLCFFGDAATFGSHEFMTLRLAEFVHCIDKRHALSVAESGAR